MFTYLISTAAIHMHFIMKHYCFSSWTYLCLNPHVNTYIELSRTIVVWQSHFLHKNTFAKGWASHINATCKPNTVCSKNGSTFTLLLKQPMWVYPSRMSQVCPWMTVLSRNDGGIQCQPIHFLASLLESLVQVHSELCWILILSQAWEVSVAGAVSYRLRIWNLNELHGFAYCITRPCLL